MVAYFAYLAFQRESLWKVARAVAWTGLAASVVSIATRGMAAHRVPWGNMYEFSITAALGILGVYLFLNIKMDLPPPDATPLRVVASYRLNGAPPATAIFEPHAS